MRPDLWDLPCLLDDRARPSFREAYGLLLQRATGLQVALTQLRLSTLDLTSNELEKVRSIRLLLTHVSAAALDAEAYAVLQHGEGAANLRRLIVLLEAGRIEVRSAPLGGWAPDFSVFEEGGHPVATLVGTHRFDAGALHSGPELASLFGASEAARLAHRFEEIWLRSHDVTPAIADLMLRVGRRARPATVP